MEEDGAQASDLLAFSLAKSWAELHKGRPDRDAWAGLAAYLDFGLSPIALFDSDATSTSSEGGMTSSPCSHVETPAPVLLDFARVIEAIRSCLQLNPDLELTLGNVFSMASIGKLPNEVDKHCGLENREALTRLRHVLAATRHAGVAPVDVERAVRAASYQGALILKEHRHHSQVILAHATAQATVIQVRLSRVDRTPQAHTTVSSILQTPKGASSPLHALLVHRRSLGQRIRFGPLEECGPALSQAAREFGCLVKLKSKPWHGKQGQVMLTFACTHTSPDSAGSGCSPESSSPVHDPQQRDAALASPQRLCQQRPFRIRVALSQKGYTLEVCMHHNHTPAKYFAIDEPVDPTKQVGRAEYMSLPLCPVVKEIIKKRAASTPGASMLNILTYLLAETQCSTSEVYMEHEQMLKDKHAATCQLMQDAGLGRKHVLFNTHPSPAAIQGYLDKIKREQRGGMSVFQACVDMAAADTTNTYFHLNKLKQAEDFSAFLIITPQMRKYAAISEYKESMNSLVYEDDTGGTDKFKSKLFTWLYMSPHTSHGIPVAFMYFHAGKNPVPGALAQALVWSYRKMEAELGGAFHLTAKMMDKCPHGHSAFAWHVGTKMKRLLDKVGSDPNVPRSLQVSAQAAQRQLGDFGAVEDASKAKWLPVHDAIQMLREHAHEVSAFRHIPEVRMLERMLHSKLFLCHFHALKAVNESVTMTLPDQESKTTFTDAARTLFKATSPQELHRHWQVMKQDVCAGPKYRKALEYLEANWLCDAWLPTWALWFRNDRSMDNTTNYVESMWNMLKYRVLKRRYNHSTYEMLVALVGGPEPDKGGCFMSYIQCREVARTYRTGARSSVQQMARESKRKGLEMILRWKKERVLEERINLQDCKTLTFKIHSESHTNTIYLDLLANPRTCGLICDCSAHGSTASCKHGCAARHYAQEILRSDVTGKMSETFGGRELSATETDSIPVDGSQMSPGCAQDPEGAASPVTESPTTTEGASELSAPEAKAIAKELAALALKMERLDSAIPSSAVRLAKRAATECDPEICWAPVLDAAAKGARSREKYVANSGNFSGHVARKLRRKKSLRTSPGKGSQVDPAHARRLKPSDTSSAQPALCKHPNRRTQQTKPSSVTSKNMVRKFSTRAPVASRPAEGSLDAIGLDTLYVAREGADAVSTKQVFRVWLADNPEHTIIVDSKGFLVSRVVRLPPKPVFLLVDDFLPLAVQRLAKAATKHWALLRSLRKAESGDCLAHMISLVLWSAFPEDAERRAGAFWRPDVLAGLGQPSAAASVTTVRGDIVRAYDAQGWDCVYVVLGNESQPQLAQCFPDGRLGPVRDQVDHSRLAHVPKAEWTEAVTHMVGDLGRLWRERGLQDIPKAMRYIHATRERSVVHPPVPFQPKFQEGDSVIARAFIPPGQGEDGESMDWGWTNGLDGWYPGRVSQVRADGTYSITFEDGDSHDRVPAKSVQVPKRLEKRLGGTKRQRERSAASLARSGAACVAEDDEDDGSEVQDGDVLSLIEQPQWYLMVNTRAQTRAYFYDPRDGKTVCGRFQEGSKVIEAEYMKLDGGELLELVTKCEPVNPQHLTGDIEEDRAELLISKPTFLARKSEYCIISRRKHRKTRQQEGLPTLRASTREHCRPTAAGL